MASYPVTSGGWAVSPSGVSLLPPDGWVVTDDVSGTSMRSPVASLADASGRHVAAQLSIRRLGSHATGGAAAWAQPVPSGEAGGPGVRPSDELLAATAQSRVAAAFADDPSAVLLDACLWEVRTTHGRRVRAVRLDVVEHDATTPVVRTSVLVPCLGGALGAVGALGGPGAAGAPGAGAAGVVEVSATVPVAHHRALVAAVETALASSVVQDEVVRDADTIADPAGRADPAGTAGSAASGLPGTDGRRPDRPGPPVPPALPGWLSGLDRGRWYVPPEAWLEAVELDIFVRGSRRLAPAHRPGPARAGLVDERGTSTPTGDLVRRAVHRPDVRLLVRAAHPGDGTEDGSASMVVDRLGPWAVLRATPPPVAARPGQPPATHRYVEVVDLAAAPARVLSWVGTGPGRSSTVPGGLELSMLVRRSGQVWGQQSAETVRVERSTSPRQVWQLVLAALV